MPTPPAKQIVLFSDGTGNSSAKAQKTNVWRLFQALDQHAADQIARYDDGVGTSSNKYLAMLGGAFGWGLRRNVLDLYKFVCRNYRPGDQIYGFGFSRGAFTIRVLVGLIAREGLVTFRSEAELDRHAAAAYRSFRYKAFPSRTPLIWTARRIRDLVLAVRDHLTRHHSYEEVFESTRRDGRDRIPIRFLGLWDTVEAYGMPIVELKRGINWLLWPMLFGDMTLSPTVERAVHALSLDDERTTFHPLLWDEQAEAGLRATKQVAAGRLTQVWFAGVHSNVGGGYPEDQTSLVALDWIVSEAQRNGLRLTEGALEDTRRTMSPYARLYDSRAGIAAFYRYSPRTTPVLTYDGIQILVNVHWTVLIRMAHGTDSYTPITLPHAFNVWTPSGTLVDYQALRNEVHSGGARTGNADLDSALLLLDAPNKEQVGIVWDTVFWRRCAYVLSMTLLGLIVAFPLITRGRENGWLDTATGGVVKTVVDGLDGLIPSAASWWKGPLVHFPLEFGGLTIALLLCLAAGGALAQRIRDRAWLVWRPASTAKYRAWRHERRDGFTRLTAAAIVVLGLAEITVRVLLSGHPTQSLQNVLRQLQLDIVGGAAILALAVSFKLLGHNRSADKTPSAGHDSHALRVARFLRKNRALGLAD